MPGPFDITPEDLGRLDPYQSVRIFHDLIFAEAFSIDGIDPSKVEVQCSNCAIPTNDGGIDGIVMDAHPGRGSHGIIKEGSTYYQIKSGKTDVTNQSSAKAMISCSEQLNPRVRNCLDNNGTLVIVLFGSDRPDREDDGSSKLIRDAISKLDPKYENYEKVEVWRQSSLCAFINVYPAIALQVKGVSTKGLITFNQWKQQRDMSYTMEKGPTQEKAISEIRQFLECSTESYLRVTGEHGIGKSRLALEALDTSSASPLVLYARNPSILVPSFVTGLALQGDYRRCILVVDDCDSSHESLLWNSLYPVSDRVTLITIGDFTNTPGTEARMVRVDPLPNEVIASILSAYNVSDWKATAFAKYCNGSPRVAHIIGQQVEASGELRITSYDDVWEAFIAGSDDVNSDSYRTRLTVLMWLSLFKRFGYRRPFDIEGNQIVKMIAHETQMTEFEIRETICDLQRRKILQGERTLYITPKLLHLWLWARWWEAQGDGFDWNRFVFISDTEKLTGQLQAWFIEMLEYARESPTVPRAIRELAGPRGPFEDEGFLATRAGGSLLYTLADTTPHVALTFIEKYLGAKTHQQLLELTQDRRALVDSLKRTAVEASLFERSAMCMFRLARAENESFANNATGEFADLFSNGFGPLAPTKATPKERLPILKEIAQSTDAIDQSIAIQAFKAALKTRRSRCVTCRDADLLHEDTQGGWIPITYGELWDAYRAVWHLAMECLPTYSPENQRELAGTLESSAIALVTFIGDGSEVVPWLKALRESGLVSEAKMANDISRLLKYSKGLSEKSREQLETLRLDLIGSDYKSEMEHYVRQHCWEEELDARGNEMPAFTKKIDKLARESLGNIDGFKNQLPWLVSTEAQNAYQFGKALGSIDTDSIAWGLIIGQLNVTPSHSRNADICAGYLDSIYPSDEAAYQNKLEELMSNDQLVPLIPSIIRNVAISDSVLERLQSAYTSGIVDAESLRPLAVSSRLGEASSPILENLLLTLARSSTLDDRYIAVEIAYFQMRRGRILNDSTLAQVITCSALPECWNDNRQNTLYLWGELVSLFVKTYPDASEEVIDAVVALYGNSDAGARSALQDPMESLANASPEKTWDAIARRLSWENYKLLIALSSSTNLAGKSLMSKFPRALIESWVKDDPDNRAALIVQCLPSELYDEDDMPTLTHDVFAAYSGRKGVQGEMRAITMSYAWFGKDSEMLTSRIETYEHYRTLESNPTVLRFIEEIISEFRENREEARLREERSDW